MSTQGKHWARVTGKLTLCIEPASLVALERIAANRGQSTSYIVREAIQHYLARTTHDISAAAVQS